MKRSRYLPVLLFVALLFGILPAGQQYLFELTLVEGHGRQFKAPVIMYTTQWCPYCHQARLYFKRHAFSYIEYDIEASAENQANYQALNGIGLPLILVGDKRMEGFSPRSFEDLLRQAGAG